MLSNHHLLFGDFSCQVGIHAVADFGLVQSVSQKEHELSDSTFGGTVIAADDTCLKKMKSGFVASHFDGTALALGDVDDDNATFAGFFQLADEPFFLGGIAGTEGLEDYGFQTGNMKHGIDNAFLNAGKERENYDIGVEKVVRLHGARRVGAADEMLVIADMDARFCQCGIVEGTESVEILGIDFGGTVAPHQLVSKKMHTSGTIGVPSGCLAAAISIAVIRFSFPSVRRVPMGSWEPVRMTGLERFSSMKLRAEAV